MFTIDYLAEWNENEKETWSGTTHNLLKAIETSCSVNNIKLSQPSKGGKLYYRIKNTISNKEYCGKLEFNESYLRFQEKQAEKLITDNVIVQIGDIVNSKNSYIYQDLSVSSIMYCKKTDDVAFRNSGFQNVSDNLLQKRAQRQNEIYQNCKGVFTMSKWLRDYLICSKVVSPSKVKYVGGGINLDTENIDSSEKKLNKFLFVGRDFERKAGPLVLEAFKLLNGLEPGKFELYIAGPTSLKDDYLFEGVHFLGDLKNEELAHYFNICDVFVMPSYFEAYGLVFIEALAYGLPVIARNSFEMKNFIEDGKTGLLIENDDPEVLSKKMKLAIESKEMKENVSLKRSYYLEEYSWEAVARRIVTTIENTENSIM